jgi:outer membrane protein assembly factor BamA
LILSGRVRHNARRACIAAGVVLLSGIAGTAAGAQILRRITEQPDLVSLRIVGNEHLSDDELRGAIATEPSRCFWRLCRLVGRTRGYTRRVLDRAELDRDLLRLRVLYWRRGWRTAQVRDSVTRRADGRVDLTLRITEGPPTRIGTIDLGPVDSLLTRHGIRSLVTIRPGDALDLIRLDTIATQIAQHLDAEGFGDVTIKPVAIVDTTNPDGLVRFDVTGLQRTFVESVRVEGTEFYDPRLVAITMGLKAGSRYSRTAAVESQRALYEAGFFKRALLRIDPGSADSLKRIVATVEELPVRSFRVTGGFSTVDFLQVDGRFTDANFRGNAGRLTLQATLGNLLAEQMNGRFVFNNVLPEPRTTTSPRYLQPTFQINADYRRRWLSDSRNQSGVGLFGYRRSAPGVFVDQGFGAAASFTRNVTRTIPVSAQYRMEFTNVSAADAYFCVNFGVCDDVGLSIVRAQRLAPIALTAAQDRRDDPIGPTRGYTWRTEFEFADTWTASQLRYGRVEVEATRYVRAADKLTIATHFRAGFVRGGSRTVGSETAAIVHPRKRFYAGGARSVRGYGENQLGPRVLVIPRTVFQPDAARFQQFFTQDSLLASRLPCDPSLILPNCPTARTDGSTTPRVPGAATPLSDFVDGDFTPKPLGAETLIEGSIEARYRLFSKVTLAAFIDAGSVGASFGGTATVYTPGVGVRFISPIGPIRLDLGYNPRLRDNLSVITEIVSARDRPWICQRQFNLSGNTPCTSAQLSSQAVTDAAQDGRLFTIDNSRSFNPATGTGFRGGDNPFGRFLNRLTLHLGIGEAF